MNNCEMSEIEIARVKNDIYGTLEKKKGVHELDINNIANSIENRKNLEKS